MNANQPLKLPRGASEPVPAPLADRVRPELFFVISSVFHYLGPAFAVLLFAHLEPLGVMWLRILSAGLVFAIWRRPWRQWSVASTVERRNVMIWAVTLVAMNACFYLAIDRLTLGTVAAIEFAGPIVIAVIALKSRRNFLAIAFAVAGVAALAEVRLSGSAVGFGFAALNTLLFCGYILLAHRTSRQANLGGIDGLAMAMVLATFVALPIGLNNAVPAFSDLRLMGAAIGVGITSSVIPYVFDQLAMKRIARETYALLAALLPATATVIGIIVLTQIPTVTEIIGVGLIILGVAIHRDRALVHESPEAPRS